MQVSSFTDVQARRCGGVARLEPRADQAMGLGLLLPSDETSGAPPKTGNRPVQSLLWKSLRLSIASCSKLARPEGGHFSASAAAHCFCCCLQVAPQEDPANKACSETCEREDFLHSPFEDSPQKTQKVKASAQKPVTSFEDSQKNQKNQRSQRDGRHIWHLPRDWGHLPEIFGFFCFFGNPRRK